DSAAVAHRPEPVRLLPAALRSGDESADRPAARDARHVVAHAPGPPRVALERPAVRRVAGRSRGGWGGGAGRWGRPSAPARARTGERLMTHVPRLVKPR